jgi:hypothetical protein
MKFKKVLTEMLNETDLSWEDRENYVKSQNLLGHRIVGTYSNEIDEMYQKELGFILDNDCKIVINGFTGYSEKTGKFIHGSRGNIIYDHLDGYAHDEDLYKTNDIDPYISTPERFAEEKEKAIFPNRKELNKFLKLLKYAENIQFKGNFDKVITGEDNFATEMKQIDLERYKDFTFEYRGLVYKYIEGNVENKYSSSIIITFKSEDENMWSQETIHFYMNYQTNSMGRLDGKPRVSISHRPGGFSDFSDIKTNVLDPLVKDIIKQIK